ncbi:MAG: GNAT family N-acetyltransferase [Oscillospiraceae bacterium]|nr:GNAT family N-acetyltransferase [Oscillospiraceae bacterium]
MKNVRHAIYRDLPELARIKQTVRGESDNPDSAMFCAELRYLTAFLDEHQSVFVWTVDGIPTAFCTVRERNKKPFCGYAYIKDLYVLPERQGRGIGKKLLTHALAKMREKGFSHAVLECAEDNTRARRFYERFGFTRTDGGLGGYITYVIDL